MIMVDTVTELVRSGASARQRMLPATRSSFLGHFPDYAIMPGTLIVEALGNPLYLVLAEHYLRMRPKNFSCWV